ncbi:MAG: metallophosphoesterase family protein [Planctomycetota bacterium]
MADTEHQAISRVALFGGVYSNYLALEAAIEDARSRGVDAMYCLGDLGAFGPYPDRVFPLLVENEIATVQGNYDHSIGNRRPDCACGYTDPRDNHFALISYEYTFAQTSDRWKDWMRELPPAIELDLAGHHVHLCHGSPRQTNEFLWESTTPNPFVARLFRDLEEQGTTADVIACTHTGLSWQRRVGDKLLVNVGVIGRPENDGQTSVSYTILEATKSGVSAEQIPVTYDWERLAAEMRSEGLPEEFIATIETGWWESCLEILPAKERVRSKR